MRITAKAILTVAVLSVLVVLTLLTSQFNGFATAPGSAPSVGATPITQNAAAAAINRQDPPGLQRRRKLSQASTP